MQSQIHSSEEFHRLLDALVRELINAQIHFKLHQDLVAAIPKYAHELNQSPTFWNLTVSAHLDAALFRLLRAYDQYDNGKPSLNLRTLLARIRDNIHLFDEPNFRQRLKDNPFVDSLASTSRKPDLAQLEQDMASVSDSDPLVKRLIIWRNNLYVHLSLDQALDPHALAKKFPFLIPDVEALLKNGTEILNRYSNLFAAVVHSTNMLGRGDYMSVLNAVRETVESHKNRVQEEIDQALRREAKHRARKQGSPVSDTKG